MSNTQRITPCEREVMRLVSLGLCSKTIGKLRGTTERTVEKHRWRAMRKLNLHNTAQLTRHFILHEETQAERAAHALAVDQWCAAARRRCV